MNNTGEIIGIFVGLDSSTYEYLASIIAPYQPQYAPVIGGFMLIDNVNEYIVARVMDYIPQGEMVSYMGRKWLSDVALTPEVIGQDIKSKKVSYQVKIKLLGRLDKETDDFTPGIKNIPHITSEVIHPSTEMIRSICNQALSEMAGGVSIGHYWVDNEIDMQFDLEQLIAKRTFIFARAGYGKSNLMKLIASKWKKNYGSLIIFDPEGEYSITDKKGRPGIMDQIPAVLITNRRRIKDELNYNVYDSLKFDLRDFHPAFIIPILVVQSKHDLIFFQKLMGLNQNQWNDLVEYLFENRWNVDHYKISDIMNLGGDVTSIQPILNNLVPPIQKLHDPNSKLLKIVEQSVLGGFPVIIDISLLDSRSALQLSSTIISYFFNKNQTRFTGGREDLFKITFVVEEAQSVIGNTTNVGKFIELAKEGRKYQLGGIFITQQPGSISKDILSQADNFFVFHLLSKTDLKALQDTNAHFSKDILTQVLNEPIKGKSYMWTSNQPFVLPVKTLNFEEIAHPNMAKDLQSKNDLLNPILGEITTITDVEKDICEKTFETIGDMGISFEDRNFIFSESTKKEICKVLYKKLNDNEWEFLDNNEGIAYYHGEPFSVSYKYFESLYEKTRIYYYNSKNN
ncbi:MAG: ATP-binding protein [Promethearchaeota archaeon]